MREHFFQIVNFQTINFQSVNFQTVNFYRHDKVEIKILRRIQS